jgi:hypothetical protein
MSADRLVAIGQERLVRKGREGRKYSKSDNVFLVAGKTGNWLVLRSLRLLRTPMRCAFCPSDSTGAPT